jgi:hypothetical protein
MVWLRQAVCQILEGDGDVDVKSASGDCTASAWLVLGLVLVLQCGAYGNPGCPTAQRFRGGIRL